MRACVGKTRPDHNMRRYVPYSLQEVRGFFNVPLLTSTEEMQETEPTFYCLLSYCLRCHSKGSTLSFRYFLRLGVLVLSGA